MQFKRQLKPEYGLKQIAIVPLIDVVLQLLIFFILSSSLITPLGISVKLPKAITSNVIKEEAFTLTITSENVVYLNNKIVSSKELGQQLKPIAEANKPLLIKADRRASVGRIVDVWDLCRKLGIEKINIATNQDN